MALEIHQLKNNNYEKICYDGSYYLDVSATSNLLRRRAKYFPCDMKAMQGIIWLGISAGVISFTLADMHIFSWLRDLVKKKSRFFGDLLSCFYCVGFWVSAVICLIYQPNIINQISVVDEVLTYFIVCGISALWGLIMCLLFSIVNK